MTLEKLSGGVDFVSDTTPAASDAIDGDVFLDTSLSPPEVKVFDASVGSFVDPRTGVSWDSKAPEIDTVSNTSLSVSGSGYIIGVSADVGSTTIIDISVDGTQLTTGLVVYFRASGPAATAVPLQHRFDTGFTFSETNGGTGVIAYVLD
jgi:hypothetical protein